MKKNTIIITSISVIIIIFMIVGLILLIYYLHKKSSGTDLDPPDWWPFQDGDEIYMSMVVSNPEYVPARMKYSYYNLVAQVNDATQLNGNRCAGTFHSINANINFSLTGSKFKVFTVGGGNQSLFALQAEQGTYCYNHPPIDGGNGESNSPYVKPNTNYIAFDLSDTQDDSVWLTPTQSDNNTWKFTTNKSGFTQGILYLTSGSDSTNNYLNCYKGTKITDMNKYGDTQAGMIIGSANIQSFYIINLTRPIPFTNDTYTFADGDLVIVSLASTNGTTYNLISPCTNNTVGAANGSQPSIATWKVKLSTDKKAFSLATSVNSNFIQPTVLIDEKESIEYSYTQLITTRNTPTDYDSRDYTTWFVLRDKKLISLLTNTAFYCSAESGLLQCGSGDTAIFGQGVFGTAIAEGFPVTITKASGTPQQ